MGDRVAYWLYRYDKTFKGDNLAVRHAPIESGDAIFHWTADQGICGYATSRGKEGIGGLEFLTFKRVKRPIATDSAIRAFPELRRALDAVADGEFQNLPNSLGQPLMEFVMSGGVFSPNTPDTPPAPVTLDNSKLSDEDVLGGPRPAPPPRSATDALTQVCDAITPPASRGLRFLLRAAALLGDQKSANAGIVSPATLLFTIADTIEQELPLEETPEEHNALAILAAATTAGTGYATARRNYAPTQSLPGAKTPRFQLRRFKLSSAAERLLAATRRRAMERGSPETTIVDLVVEMVETTSGRLEQLKVSFHLDVDKLRDALGQPIPATATMAATATLPRTHADAVEEDSVDLLNVGAEVETFARFVAARDTHLPLAIGVFGDWGHGKSFFMQAVKKRVKQFAEQARKTEVAGGTSPFHPHIAHIEFNAWHYIEADLWASLADHLFTQLDRHFQTKPDEQAQARKLLDELDSAKAVARETEQQEQAAQKRLDTAHAQLQETQAAYATALGTREMQRITWPTAGKILAKQALSTPELQQAWRDLGMPAEIASGERVRASLDDLQRTAGSARATWRALTAGTGWNRPTLWLTLAFLCLSPLLAFVLSTPVGEEERTLLGMLIGGACGAIPFVRQLCTLWRTAQDALAKLTTAKDTIAKGVTSEQNKAVHTMAEAEAAVAAQAAALEQARTARSEAADKLTALQQQIEASTPQERMRRFLAERVADGTYAGKLGIVATIRKDIETLTDLLLPTKQDKDPTLPRLDRIILYIDDLDRCPAPLVVKVLQAIHLLLAFRLFVVVVAVDVRWLMASLKNSYPHLLADGSRTDDETEDRPASTHDYLEKIFQLPYWVQPMGGDAASGYARRLMEENQPPVAPPFVKPSRPGPDTDSDASVETVPTTPPAGEPFPERDQTPSPSPSEAEQQMQQASLSADEIEDIAALAPLLGGSPRRVKRFINLYSLIKVGLNDRAQSLSSPEREALLTNLVVAAGAPRLAPDYFRELRTGADLTEVVAAVDAWPEAKKDAGWQSARKALNDTLSLTDLRHWAPLAQRYSFTTEPPDTEAFTPPPSSPATP